MATPQDSRASDNRREAIIQHLASKSTTPTPEWLNAFLATIDGTVPLATLQQTASAAILSSDITTSVQARDTFPTSLADGDKKEQTLAGPVLVQLLDIEDIGSSAWSQVEAMEAVERGETTRGREVIRVLPSETEADTPTRHGGPFKLSVQDTRAQSMYALVLDHSRINLDTPIGTKLLLKNIVVARGVLLLDNSNVQILGGTVEQWNSTWKRSHKKRLMNKVRSV